MPDLEDESDVDNVSPSRNSEGPEPCHIVAPPFGLLPSAFADEHVSIAGVTEPLLPPASFQPQQQHQLASTTWGQFAEDVVSAPWSDHWQSFWMASSGRDASPSQQVGSSLCLPGCILHSRAYHSAALLIENMIAFPANYVQQWRPEKTDEVLFWLNRQIAFEASSPDSSSGRMVLPFQPTRQDAELLRICKHETLTSKESRHSKLTTIKSSTSFPASKRLSMEIRT